MRKTSVRLFIFALVIGLILMLVSNRLSATIENMLREDMVAVLELAVEVDHVDIKLANGRVKIIGLEVNNLDGFPSENVFDMSHIEVDVAMLSMIPAMLGWSPFRLENIHIEAPIVSVDIDRDGRSNLKLILDKIRQSQQAAIMAKKNTSPQSPPPVPAKSGSEEQPAPVAEHHQARRFSVDQLTINDLSFNLSRAGKEDHSGTLAPINMQAIGGERGTTVADIGIKLSARLATDILAAVLLHKAVDDLGSKLMDNLRKSEK